MSHFTCVKTKIMDLEQLIGTLQDMGYAPEVGRDIRLYGYRGDLRQDTADVVIRRNEISASSNDLGFAQSDEGMYDAIISEYDVRQFPNLVNQITQRYAERVILKNAMAQGYNTVEREVMGDGSIRLRMEQWM
ncbi:MAG: DUF1257 domain-containing protein [Anaerolineae bacterium]|nr:DUF1257 domain-containing protein [Anaerolineae bacterium]